jgi:predicted nuclease with TOPRIM domain
MNPITLIEKLINEHGSSTILKERLELLKDQITALEKENGGLKSENTGLKDKAKHLESKFNDATKEIQRLNEIINSSQKHQGIKKYDEITEKVLKVFFQFGRELSIYDCVRALSLDVSTIRYHFDLLSEDNLIIQTKSGFESSWIQENSPDMYDLTPSGRKYIVEKRLT